MFERDVPNDIDRQNKLMIGGDKNLQNQKKPIYDVFLGGSCGNTCWRSEIVIPYLKTHGLSYYDPQRPVWSENMIREEQRAKENSRIFLFVLDPGTINATSFLEIAYFASRKASKLVVVFLGRHEWSDKALKVDLPDRIRTCNLLEAILKRHSVLMLTSINEALDFVDEKIIRDKPFAEALSSNQQRLPYLKLNARRCLNTCSDGLKKAKSFCKTRLFAHFRRFTILLAFEMILVLLFNFVLSPFILSPAFGATGISIWVLIIPILAFNYLLLLAFVIYYRFKSNRRKRKIQRTLLLPMPPLPRVSTMGDSLSQHQNQQNFRGASRTTFSSSQSSNSLAQFRLNSASNSNGYEPMIELIISGSTTAGGKQQHSVAYNRPNNNNRNKEKQKYNKISPTEKSEKLRLNGCLTSPVGYDVFLSCSSSSELDWITQKAVPELHKNGLSYTSALMCDSRMRIPFLHTASHILYYIPSYKTFLSGMIEVAYFIGHADWQVTVCVPREAECLVLLDGQSEKLDPEIYAAVERRNECYRMAFSYLKDMAARRQVKVFTRVEDAVRHIRERSTQDQKHQQINEEIKKDNQNQKENQTEIEDEKQLEKTSLSPSLGRKTALRQILEKQHLVKERTSQNLLAYLQEAAARGQKLELDLAEIRPDSNGKINGIQGSNGNLLKPNS
ncbi:hypothetical protein ACQ4LE_009530 [Meloidogyne hapla]|uniref:Uncharacterized protein n=1 Tax=Meloidogyne hapla TaxID=6305 RepID=A0A1I8BW54_MELHA